jgi:hypothetical protein
VIEFDDLIIGESRSSIALAALYEQVQLVTIGWFGASLLPIFLASVQLAFI